LRDAKGGCKMPAPMSPSCIPLGHGDRVLVIRLGAVGDVIRTLPALHRIRTTFPGVHLAWIVEDLSRDLLAGHPEIDEVIRFPRQELREAAARPGRLVTVITTLSRVLRERRFTVAIDFQGSLKSGFVALLSGASRRVGFAPGHTREMSFLFSNEWVRPRARRQNRVVRNLVLAEAIGAVGNDVEVILPERPEDGRRAEVVLRGLDAGGAPVVVLSPGTSLRQRGKRWPAVSYTSLAVLIRQSGVIPLVVWGPGEEEVARSIVLGSHGAAALAPPTGLGLLAAILRRVSLFVGADTGPMHLAWGVGCPVVALFGPTDPRLNAPWGRGHIVLRNGFRTSGLGVETVFAAVRQRLDTSRP
jgi:lipopolysaccharide heptosyltransferase I